MYVELDWSMKYHKVVKMGKLKGMLAHALGKLTYCKGQHTADVSFANWPVIYCLG
jgi:hypothetical protein